MSSLVDKEREDNHTREEYSFERNLLSIFLKVCLKSTCSQSF